MAKFGKKSNTSQDIPTAALPDIIFMLLFFFMVTTVLRETDILVKQQLPKAIQLTKLESKFPAFSESSISPALPNVNICSISVWV